MTSASDSSGHITFTGITPGKYTLQETTPPDGYELSLLSHQIIIDMDGTAAIDGSPANGFILYNTSYIRNQESNRHTKSHAAR